MKSKMMAIILAGGRGSRMDILCQAKPRPVLPYAGKFRVVDFALSNCLNSGIEQALVLIDYQRSQMADYVNHWRLTNKGLGKLDYTAPAYGSYHGAANAVYQNLAIIQNSPAEAVLILTGDHVCSMDYRSMLAWHEYTKAEVTVGVAPVPREKAQHLSTVIMEDDGRFTAFTGESSDSDTNLASMGIYIFNKNILVEALSEDNRDDTSPHDFNFGLLPKLVQKHKVAGYQFYGYWRDIGTVKAYYEANMESIGLLPEITASDWPIYTRRTSPVVETRGNTANIQDSIISPGCVIKGRVENSVISPGVFIDDKAIVRNSIILPNASIGYYSIVDSSIIDENAVISSFCYVGLGNVPEGKERLTVIGQDARIPAHTAIGRNCKIMPYVRPNDIHSSAIPGSSVIMAHGTYEKVPVTVRGESMYVTAGNRA